MGPASAKMERVNPWHMTRIATISSQKPVGLSPIGPSSGRSRVEFALCNRVCDSPQASPGKLPGKSFHGRKMCRLVLRVAVILG
jgi:hypothetical protein